ncbi:MAG: 30S ribosomal protein S15 [Alphaproteobacteria bacterium]|nr:30S ribosomal protein S15 [Alphaproteobacteria bacterium]
MSITKEQKQSIIKEYAIKEGDTGSAQVQIAVLTAEISALSEHMKVHKKDFHSRRGLMAMVANRRRLLAYIKKNDTAAYDSLIARLGLRK